MGEAFRSSFWSGVGWSECTALLPTQGDPILRRDICYCFHCRVASPRLNCLAMRHANLSPRSTPHEATDVSVLFLNANARSLGCAHPISLSPNLPHSPSWFFTSCFSVSIVTFVLHSMLLDHFTTSSPRCSIFSSSSYTSPLLSTSFLHILFPSIFFFFVSPLHLYTLHLSYNPSFSSSPSPVVVVVVL